MVFGGHVLKKPADDPEPATEAVIAVVPGCAAVITFVALFSVAIVEVLTLYVSAPIESEQLGSEVTPGARPPGQERFVTVEGAQSSYWVPFAA